MSLTRKCGRLVAPHNLTVADPTVCNHFCLNFRHFVLIVCLHSCLMGFLADAVFMHIVPSDVGVFKLIVSIVAVVVVILAAVWFR